MSDVTQQIKDRLSVVDVLREYIKLDRAGSNFKALCPFHNEKTPSFMVNPDRNFWYCFGCQKGGDIFSFVMEMEGIGFRDALERLAERVGVEIPKFHPIHKEEKDQRQRIFDLLEAVTKFYEFQLEKSQNGTLVRKYLNERNILNEQIKDFRIGYAPDGWSNILNFLLSRGHKLSDIIQSGLLVSKNNAPSGKIEDYYDRFRNRIMFPVIDNIGRVIGYSARVLPGSDEKNAKYINTSQSPVYDKSSVLYGIYQAKTEIKKNNFVIVVEGNMDVVASNRAGVKNIVAVSGTALTSAHVRILKRYTNNFKLCFDMDKAGQMATRKSIQTCLKEGIEVEVILLPKGAKDVNDLVIRDPSLWVQSIEGSIQVMKYFFESAFSQYDRNDVLGKKKIAQELLNIIKDITDPIEKNYWVKKLSASLSVDEETLTEILKKATLVDGKISRNRDGNNDKKTDKNKILRPKKIVLQERLLGLFSLFPNELGRYIAEIDEDIFDDSYKIIWESIKSGDNKKFDKVLNEYGMAIKFSYDEKDGFRENEVDVLEELKIALQEIDKEVKKKRIKQIVWDIKKAEEIGDEEALNVLMIELAELSKEEIGDEEYS